MEAIDRIVIKLDRAKDHQRDLEVEVRRFIDGNPYAVETKRDPNNRRLIYFVARAKEVPPKISAIAGDVLQNLRSALDHLAFELFKRGGGTGDGKHVYFPIFDDAAAYVSGSPGKTAGMKPDAVNAIHATKPYKGGNDVLWKLHRLNIVDKHRSLFTVGAAFRSVDLMASILEMMKATAPEMAKFAWPPFFVRPGDRMFPLKVDDELFVDLPDANVSPTMQFRFDVALGEPGIVEGEAIIDALQQMIDEVGSTIRQFEPLLR